jgi:hypothetical protein
MISFNLLKQFKEDLNKAVVNDIKSNRTKRLSIQNVIFFSGFLGTFILFKPFFIYYKGYFERLEKIEQLKRKNKFVLDKDN